MTISVLCAASNSIYHTLPAVIVYDAKRDARSFDGSTPIVAHPPCRAWSAFCAHQAKPDAGERELGLWCVEQLRECGGVLEHPAYSRLFDAADIPKPREGERNGLWSMAVNQSWWGDARTKKTWLCFSHIDQNEVEVPYRLHNPRGDKRRWQVMSKNQRSATNKEMAEWLVSMARLSEVRPPVG